MQHENKTHINLISILKECDKQSNFLAIECWIKLLILIYIEKLVNIYYVRMPI